MFVGFTWLSHRSSQLHGVSETSHQSPPTKNTGNCGRMRKVYISDAKLSDSLQESSESKRPISRSMVFPVELRDRHTEALAAWKEAHGCRFHAKTYSSERNPTGGLAATSIMSGGRASCWLNCCCWNWFLNGMVEMRLDIATEYQDKIFIQPLDGSR